MLTTNLNRLFTLSLFFRGIGIKVMSCSSSNGSSPRFLNQEESIKLDEDLMGSYSFTLAQLMELAGLSVATAVSQTYGTTHADSPVVVVCGPGNNGGDGIVAARHLRMFGFSNVNILMQRQPQKPFFINLLHQATLNDVKVIFDPADLVGSVGLFVDALFGFSFKPPVRQDSVAFLSLMINASNSGVPVVSVDIPSGWNVEEGPPVENPLLPHTLISLSAPKKCAEYFTGAHHFLGGRFIPNNLALKYNLNLPLYDGTQQIIKLK